jgi:hypothetical protein
MLFDYDFPKDNSPVDDTEIKTTILYYSKQEHDEFKALCKKAMVDFYGADAIKNGNISDVLLQFLRTRYGKDYSEKSYDRRPSGGAQSKLFE